MKTHKNWTIGNFSPSMSIERGIRGHSLIHASSTYGRTYLPLSKLPQVL